MNLEDFYYVKLRGYHKHIFKRVGEKIFSTSIGKYSFPFYLCLECGRKLLLDDWEMADLPTSMRYEKIRVSTEAGVEIVG